MSDRFNPTVVTEEGRLKIKQARELFTEFGEKLRAVMPTNRETALTLTNLEQAGFWAVRSIAIEHEDGG